MQQHAVFAAVRAAGYPTHMAEQLAGRYYRLFDGDVDKFVDLVEAIMDAEDSAPAPSLEGCHTISW